MGETAEKLPTRQEFSAVLDSTFRVEPANGTVFDASLVECNGLVSNEVQENFTLLFRAPSDAPPAQGIYRMTHDGLGTMDLFLVPIKKDESGLYYEAVFNHLLG